MRMHVIGLAAVLAWGGSAPGQPADQHASNEDKALSEWSVDELIDALPRAGTEWQWDGEEGSFDPVCEEMARRILRLQVNEAQWEAMLRTTGAISLRDRWPIDEPFAVSMVVPQWMDLTQVRMTPRDGRWYGAVAGMTMWQMCGTASMLAERAATYQEIGRLEPGPQEIVFDVEVERGRPSHFRQGDAISALLPTGVLWKGEMRFRVTGVATIDQAVPPADSARLREAVKDALGAGVREWWIDERRQPRWYVVVDPDTAAFPELRSTGLSLRVEALRDGDPVEEGRIVAGRSDPLLASNSVRKGALRFYGSRNLPNVPPEVLEDEQELARWSVRVRGTSEHVLRLWDAETRWGGELEVPLAELVRLERERTGPGGRSSEISTPW